MIDYLGEISPYEHINKSGLPRNIQKLYIRNVRVSMEHQAVDNYRLHDILSKGWRYDANT